MRHWEVVQEERQGQLKLVALRVAGEDLLPEDGRDGIPIVPTRLLPGQNIGQELEGVVLPRVKGFVEQSPLKSEPPGLEERAAGAPRDVRAGCRLGGGVSLIDKALVDERWSSVRYDPAAMSRAES